MSIEKITVDGKKCLEITVVEGLTSDSSFVKVEMDSSKLVVGGSVTRNMYNAPTITWNSTSLVSGNSLL